MKCPFCNQDNTRVVDSRPAMTTLPSGEEECVMRVENDLPLMRKWRRFRGS